MFVTYKPEDGDERRWTFDPGRVRASKAEMIEKRAGQSWDQWRVAVQAGSIAARRVLLWHLLTLDHPTFRWEDTPDFYADELVIEHSVAELNEVRARVDKANLSAEEKEAFYALFDQELTEAMAREEAGAAGKAPSNSGASGTPSP